MATILPTNPNIVYSPCTWHQVGTNRVAYNSGAYFKFMTNALVTGNKTLNLLFDVSGNVLNVLPVISYRIGGREWVDNPIAASIPVGLPAGGATTEDPVLGQQAWHYIEVWVRTVSPYDLNKWGASVTQVVLTGLQMDDAATLTPIQPSPLKGCFFGDSITEGFAAMSRDRGNYQNNNVLMTWGYSAMQALGCEAGIVGYSGQGFTKSGEGNVPPFPQTYTLLQPGINRDLSDCDIIVINQGTNDYAVDSSGFTAAALPVMQNLLTLAPHAFIMPMVPFNQTQANGWRNVVLALNSPRVKLIETAGFYPQDIAGSLHPSGSATLGFIAPKLNVALATAWGQYQYRSRGRRTTIPQGIRQIGVPVLHTTTL